MYLDFILDIAKVGDIINITTKEQTIEGEIMKISSSFCKLTSILLSIKLDNLETNLNSSLLLSSAYL